MMSKFSTTPQSNLAEMAFRALTAPATLHAQANAALAEVGSDEHVQTLDRVARARCAEWLDREHGMDLVFARGIVDQILDIYSDSTRVRR